MCPVEHNNITECTCNGWDSLSWFPVGLPSVVTVPYVQVLILLVLPTEALSCVSSVRRLVEARRELVKRACVPPTPHLWECLHPGGHANGSVEAAGPLNVPGWPVLALARRPRASCER